MFSVKFAMDFVKRAVYVLVNLTCVILRWLFKMERANVAVVEPEPEPAVATRERCVSTPAVDDREPPALENMVRVVRSEDDQEEPWTTNERLSRGKKKKKKNKSKTTNLMTIGLKQPSLNPNVDVSPLNGEDDAVITDVRNLIKSVFCCINLLSNLLEIYALSVFCCINLLSNLLEIYALVTRLDHGNRVNILFSELRGNHGVNGLILTPFFRKDL
jgi:hypothetical protein